MKIDKVASVAVIVLGIWLFLTMFLWRHSSEHVATAGIVGVLSILLGALAYRGHVWARWIVIPLSVWLFASGWLLPHGSVGWVVNALTIGTLLFGFSALPTGRGRAIGPSPF